MCTVKEMIVNFMIMHAKKKLKWDENIIIIIKQNKAIREK